MSTVALIAAYNEESTAADTIRRVLKYVDKAIFCNDGSTDGTLRNVVKSFSKNQRVKILSWDENRGKGYALIQGFKKFLKSSGDILVTFDADGQHYSEEIPSLTTLIEKNISDVVIGARILTQSPSRVRIFFNVMVNIVMLLTTGSMFVDVSSGLRAYSKTAVKKILPYLTLYDFGIEPEIMRAAAVNKLKVSTVPINVNYQKGKKGNIWRLANSYLRFAWTYKDDIFRRIFGRTK